MLGVGILITLINVMLSMRFGEIAGKNPPEFDGLGVVNRLTTRSPTRPYTFPPLFPAIPSGTITTKIQIPTAIACWILPA